MGKMESLLTEGQCVCVLNIMIMQDFSVTADGFTAFPYSAQAMVILLLFKQLHEHGG